MIANNNNHDQINKRVRNRLKTTSLGLRLVQLLLDAGRTEEARTTLRSLQHGYQKPEASSREPLRREEMTAWPRLCRKSRCCIR